jgi:hypothetical protein
MGINDAKVGERAMGRGGGVRDCWMRMRCGADLELEVVGADRRGEKFTIQSNLILLGR